jgi:hypothetical protein
MEINSLSITASLYRTTDTPLSAALQIHGHYLIRLEFDPQGRCEFVFSDSEACEEDASLFWSGKLKVPALAYATALKVLKGRIYARR